MKWLTNIPDPRRAQLIRESQEERHYHDWLADKVIGPPQGTAFFTAERLVAMGMVGVYAAPPADDDHIKTTAVFDLPAFQALRQKEE